MKKYQEVSNKKMYEMFNNAKIDYTDTPAKYNEDCGNCTGDKPYNKNYYTECKETDNFIYINNSCQDYVLDKRFDEDWKVYEEQREGKKIVFSKLNKSECLELLKEIKEEIKNKEIEEVEDNAEMIEELKNL